jgi:hypothetical protein
MNFMFIFIAPHFLSNSVERDLIKQHRLKMERHTRGGRRAISSCAIKFDHRALNEPVIKIMRNY